MVYKNKKNKLLFLFYLISILLSFVLLSERVNAHCPLCTAATGAAVATTRFVGIDDLVVGTFIGGFLISTAFWFDNILKRRNKGRAYFVFQLPVIVAFTFITTFLSLQFAGIINGESSHHILGIDKLLAGSLVGGMVTIFSFSFSSHLRENSGKNFIPFQSIVFILVFLALTNLLFYLGGLI